MHIHILGICGTFMGGLAVLASELNMKVTGADQNVYPPMSTQLKELGIQITEGYGEAQLKIKPDCVVVGNVMSRGMPVIEALLEQGSAFVSGPEWLAQHVLSNRHVLAVSGTHGKTTTASLLAWILDYAGLNPGFLIGGVPQNFGLSARLGSGRYFVVEADEYDSAFFDKRSKFIHYRPRTLIINNIEFDHADIFRDLLAIQQQFHHLVRTIPGQGLIIHPKTDEHVAAVLNMGCWTKTVSFGMDTANWQVKNVSKTGDAFEVYFEGNKIGQVKWGLLGEHNRMNALAALAASHHVGVLPATALLALQTFKGVKRRLEVKGTPQGIVVYDDFAHHPTAIETTLMGLRAKVGADARIIAVLDIRSNTMRAGHHKEHLAPSVKAADEVYFFKSADILWDVENVWEEAKKPGGVYTNEQQLLAALIGTAKANDHLVFMSNGGFGGIQNNFLTRSSNYF